MRRERRLPKVNDTNPTSKLQRSRSKNQVPVGRGMGIEAGGKIRCNLWELPATTCNWWQEEGCVSRSSTKGKLQIPNPKSQKTPKRRNLKSQIVWGGVYLTPCTRPPVRGRILPSDRECRTRPIPVRRSSGTRPPSFVKGKRVRICTEFLSCRHDANGKSEAL